ncbi:ABC-type Fe3+-hydroxamate transport system, substrate-binding protein [Paenibacillus sp. 1_12]|uniref:AraC family transcriptional regulator n=1 Tax=Paenibacillus sp. 1_12 TaxID=1566278 RepID=UPI0008E57396|nr:helix-turn-helix domain-containing protein [Paenibacillus sp. 1_12]SFL75596.1 ABC-type Fe3+-hydroxamate transport system, substrate-binding protein [Paenibacillus sp. 1_12]
MAEAYAYRAMTEKLHKEGTMIEPNDIFSRLNELVVRVTDVDHFRSSEPWCLQPEILSMHQVVFMHRGSAIFDRDGNSSRLGPGHLLFLAKGQKVQAASVSGEPLVMYTISFSYQSPIRKTEKGHLYRKEGMVFPLNGDFYIHSQPKLLHLCEQLLDSMSESEQGRRQYRQTCLLHELLYLAASEIEAGDEQQLTAVERTVEYLNHNYMLSIQLDDLSRLAGFSSSYYSRLFKKLKGISPFAYMTKLRMKRAKELLMLSQGSLTEISKHLGYSEEAYFSRVFKKETGYSPAYFVRLHRQKIVNMKGTFNGDLVALGVIPYASVRVGTKGGPSFEGKLDEVTRISADGKACKDALIDLQPDIIVCDSQWAKYNKDAFQIAPTAVIPYWDIPWRERLYRIAELVGKRKEAKEWLQDYDRQAALVSRTLKSLIGEATVIILRIVCGKLRLYGVERNIGSVLYQDLKLNAPAEVKEIKWRRTISLELLSQLNADYILLMVSSHKADQKLLSKLRASQEWNHLSAVQRKQCYEIDLYPWIDYSAQSHKLIIDATIGLFVKS